VLLPYATQLEHVDASFKTLLNHGLINAIVALIPDTWLADEPAFSSVDEHRKAYSTFLNSRIAHSDIFVKEAQDAKATLI
jgi:hypothetical protein